MGFEISGWPCCCSTVIMVVVAIWLLVKQSKEKDSNYEKRLKHSTNATNNLRDELADLRAQIDNSKAEDQAPDSPDSTPPEDE